MKKLSSTFLRVSPKKKINIDSIKPSLNIFYFIQKTSFLKSKSEIIRSLKENSISVNKQRVSSDFNISSLNLLCKRYILLQRGKKNYFLVVIEH